MHARINSIQDKVSAFRQGSNFLLVGDLNSHTDTTFASLAFLSLRKDALVIVHNCSAFKITEHKLSLINSKVSTQHSLLDPSEAFLYPEGHKGILIGYD